MVFFIKKIWLSLKVLLTLFLLGLSIDSFYLSFMAGKTLGGAITLSMVMLLLAALPWCSTFARTGAKRSEGAEMGKELFSALFLRGSAVFISCGLFAAGVVFDQLVFYSLLLIGVLLIVGPFVLVLYEVHSFSLSGKRRKTAGKALKIQDKVKFLSFVDPQLSMRFSNAYPRISQYSLQFYRVCSHPLVWVSCTVSMAAGATVLAVLWTFIPTL